MVNDLWFKVKGSVVQLVELSLYFLFTGGVQGKLKEKYRFESLQNHLYYITWQQYLTGGIMLCYILDLS